MLSDDLRTAISPVSRNAALAARDRIDRLSKSQGGLERIEELAARLAGIAGDIPTCNYERRVILVGVGDHGVAAQRVSACTPEATVQTVNGFLDGGAAMNAFARAVRAEVYVADFGMRIAPEPHPRLIDCNVGRGTADFSLEPALTREEAERSLAAGVAAFEEVARRTPFEVLALGETGVGAAASATAIIAAFTGEPPSAIAGRGAGIDDERLARKTAVVEEALQRMRDFHWKEVAMQVGGYEITGLAGIILAAARARVPVVLDGFIVAASALIADAIAPHATGYCIAAHRSQESGHTFALQALGLHPLLDVDVRLGEGGAVALAFPLIEAAARITREMKTFAQADAQRILRTHG